MTIRNAVISRKTRETEIDMEFTVDGSGKAEIETGVGFFDHMLDSFSRHGFFDLKLAVKGDLYVDSHHTVEDTGIVLGQAIKKALGDKQGIKRYGSCILPMDESLVLCAIDLSGRPYLSYELDLTADRLGYMEAELVKEFFYALSYSAGMNLHIKKISGGNNHHVAEAAFKAFAKALDEACGYDQRISGVLSTKGSME
ncbi:imidazoleglycerol-phosphate dehydratase [Anaerotaenia torta]|uniref:imidazoleglycerol-phosphate dehydratase HisB n=1 Tax=Anaerotaenia torta TaxID=433293 RepID=UPI003D1A347F